MNTEYNELLKVAENAACSAHAKYSKFRVGAAVKTEVGTFIGFNIEISSSPLGICAEKAAITNALIHGAKNILAIAVCCVDADLTSENILNLTMPCGSCRQWIFEFAKDAIIVTNGSDAEYRINDLLPIPFSLD